MMAHENRITRPPSAYIKRLYVDTANASLPNQLANLAMMGAGQMLFGTDSPPLSTPVQVAIDLVNQLPIADEDKWNIFSGNARRLFKLDAGRGGA